MIARRKSCRKILVQASERQYDYLERMRRNIPHEIWEEIKTAYAAGIGLREIARKMDIPQGTVLAHAKRHRWTPTDSGRDGAADRYPIRCNHTSAISAISASIVGCHIGRAKRSKQAGPK